MPLVCVDASLVLMLLLPDQHSNLTDALFARWTRENTTIQGPPLLYAEVPSALREAVHFGRISFDEGESLFDSFCALSIAVCQRGDLHVLAWDLAKEHHGSRLYDSMYVAAARAEQCDLWTGDRRLASVVNLPWVKWVGRVRGEAPRLVDAERRKQD